MDIIFWDFLILYQIFFSLEVKRSVIIINKHGIYEYSTWYIQVVSRVAENDAYCWS